MKNIIVEIERMSEDSTDGTDGECYLLNLNDDCFYEVYKRLKIIDWCSLRDSCTRLRPISDECFKRQCKSFALNGTYITDSMYADMPVKDIKRLFRHFGHLISKLVIHKKAFEKNEDHAKAILAVDRYCTALENLKLVKIELDSVTIVQCGRLFSNLQRLVIDNCCDDEATFATCLTHCRSLKELELIRLVNVEGTFLAQQFGALESFSMKSCGGFNYDFIRIFFERNPQLKSLKFVSCTFITDQVLRDSSVFFPNLEALSLRFDIGFRSVDWRFDEDVEHLARLTQLKKFEMDFWHFGLFDKHPLLTTLAALNSIETLHLAALAISDELTRDLCELKTLKILKLTSTTQLDASVFQKLASELPSLLEIHIIECANITFSELKEFVEHSTTLKKIVFSRSDDTVTSLTKDTYLSLVEAQQRKRNQETINIHLNYDDYREVEGEFTWEGNLKILQEQAHVINVLSMEEEDATTLYEYGNAFKKRITHYDDLHGFGEYSNDGMSDVSGSFNDEFGDVFDDDFDDDYDDDFDDDFGY